MSEKVVSWPTTRRSREITKLQISTEIKRARASCSPFWPLGQFISWCRKSEYSAAGLPDEDEFYDIVMKYSARRGLYETPKKYPWQTNSDYWMVTSLYSTMRAQGLSEQELRLKCRRELQRMAMRIQSDEQISPPRAQVEKLYLPVSNERALAHIGKMKALFKRNCTKP